MLLACPKGSPQVSEFLHGGTPWRRTSCACHSVIVRCQAMILLRLSHGSFQRGKSTQHHQERSTTSSSSFFLPFKADSRGQPKKAKRPWWGCVVDMRTRYYCTYQAIFPWVFYWHHTYTLRSVVDTYQYGFFTFSFL